ncbi:hypothetical protein HPP92_018991 [Vanilla planifolia]|uniref:Uncharacterized protein n=1 Tax=Vanilla planifolia TaxID=51239 RepID=A0A835UPW9_VANPL|nr:hypothetical protein HPP92_018991 [Vanilla planifolia]
MLEKEILLVEDKIRIVGQGIPSLSKGQDSAAPQCPVLPTINQVKQQSEAARQGDKGIVVQVASPGGETQVAWLKEEEED